MALYLGLADGGATNWVRNLWASPWHLERGSQARPQEIAVSLTRLLTGLIICGLASYFAAAPAPARAQNQGFIVSPAFQEIILTTGQPQTQYVLQLSNTTARDQNFQLSVVDFGSLNESGGVAFLGTPATELENRYGLAAWMSLGTNSVFLAAGKSSQIIVTIANRPSMSPGGHYGAILATAVSDTGKATGNDSRVNLRQVLSSLVLLTKDGGITANLELVNQSFDRSGFRLPSLATQRFQNTGNVHLVPRGTVVIRDPLGRAIARGALNDGSGSILPDSFRRYQTPIKSIATAWLPGNYQAVTTYRYDGTEQTKTLTTSFWYMGLGIVWLTSLVTVGCISFFSWLFWRTRQD